MFVAVMMLDSDVQISCEDLKFSLVSWQSSQHSIVGFFPRLHKATTKPGKAVDMSSDDRSVFYEFLDHWSYVWYNQEYSLLLPAGAIVHKHYLEDLCSFKARGSDKKTHMANALHAFLGEHNECAEIALNVWVAGMASGFGDDKDAEQPPVWLDISKSYVKSPSFKSSSVFGMAEGVRKRERSKCLTEIASLLNVKWLPRSKYKGVQSKTQLWW